MLTLLETVNLRRVMADKVQRRMYHPRPLVGSDDASLLCRGPLFPLLSLCFLGASILLQTRAADPGSNTID